LWLYSPESLVRYNAIGTTVPVPDREIDLSSLIYNIQGIAYDDEDDTYWAVGTSGPTSPGTNNIMIHVDSDGGIIGSAIDLTFLAASFQLGMMAVNNNADETLIKANNNVDLWFLDKGDLTLSRTETSSSMDE